jgi:glucose-1-phosphate thymidylyltransferase
MKGIILAGGTGSRLWPTTRGVSKQLLPVYDKPMIYYPLSVLMLSDVRDILIITTVADEQSYRNVLGDGSKFGVRLTYAVQEHPRGIADAFIVGESFIGSSDVCLVLGDNIFWGQGLSDQLLKSASSLDGGVIFGYRVRDPQRFGVVEYDANGAVSRITEKPNEPQSDVAVTGLYFFSNNVVELAKQVQESERGELEITSILNLYVAQKRLKLEMFGRGFAWLDTGTSSALLEASSFIETIERQQGFKVACLEEIALKKNWISKDQLRSGLSERDKSSYGSYLWGLTEIV